MGLPIGAYTYVDMLLLSISFNYFIINLVVDGSSQSFTVGMGHPSGSFFLLFFCRKGMKSSPNVIKSCVECHMIHDTYSSVCNAVTLPYPEIRIILNC